MNLFCTVAKKRCGEPKHNLEREVDTFHIKDGLNRQHEIMGASLPNSSAYVPPTYARTRNLTNGLTALHLYARPHFTAPSCHQFVRTVYTRPAVN